MYKQSRKWLMIIVGCLMLIAVGVVGGQSGEDKSELRCGWFSNPTPANASLYDRDAEWIIAVQGGYQAEGDWPDIPRKQWIITNVHYGYGCACLRVRVDQSTKHVKVIESSKARPLSACRNDKKLKKWGFK